jgi:hypothetical protein
MLSHFTLIDMTFRKSFLETVAVVIVAYVNTKKSIPSSYGPMCTLTLFKWSLIVRHFSNSTVPDVCLRSRSCTPRRFSPCNFLPSSFQHQHCGYNADFKSAPFANTTTAYRWNYARKMDVPQLVERITLSTTIFEPLREFRWHRSTEMPWMQSDRDAGSGDWQSIPWTVGTAL